MKRAKPSFGRESRRGPSGTVAQGRRRGERTALRAGAGTSAGAVLGQTFSLPADLSGSQSKQDGAEVLFPAAAQGMTPWQTQAWFCGIPCSGIGMGSVGHPFPLPGSPGVWTGQAWLGTERTPRARRKGICWLQVSEYRQGGSTPPSSSPVGREHAHTSSGSFFPAPAK